MMTAIDPPPIEFLQLVAEPIRWRLLQDLARSDRRVAELRAAVDKPLNLVSYHLGVLRRAGLVAARRSSADGRDTYYRIDLDRCRQLFTAASAALEPALAPSGAAGSRGASTPPRRRSTPRVLFLCTGNSARSQIAEALTVARSDGRVEARSAGSHPKALHPNAVRVLAERGIDIAGHPTTHVRRFVRSHFDVVVTLCDKVREVCPEFPGDPAVIHWSIADPAQAGATDDASYPAFQQTADDLEQRIAALLPRLVDTSPREEGHRARR